MADSTSPANEIQRPGAPAAGAAPSQPSRAAIAWSVAPSIMFLGTNELAGLPPAIVVTSLLAATLTVSRHRRGHGVGLLLPASLVFVVTRASAGLASGSEDVYFGVGIALNVLVALGVLATAATTRPAGSAAIQVFVSYSPATRAHPLFHRVGVQVTVAWVFAELTLAAWEFTHLGSTSASGFMWLRMLVGWPAMAMFISALIFYVRLRLDPIEAPRDLGEADHRSALLVPARTRDSDPTVSTG